MPGAPTSSGKLLDLIALVLLLLTTYLAVQRAPGETTLYFELGPNDHRYLSGFASHYEVADGSATRWTTYDASIHLPFTVEGNVTISYRFARVFAETAEVELALAGATVDRFTARGGRAQTREVRLRGLSPTPLSLSFHADSHERRDRGLRLDWLRVDLDEDASARPRGSARSLPPLLTAFFYALFRFGGLRRLASVVLALPWVVACYLGLRVDPFAFAHVVPQLTGPLVVLSTGAAAFLRRFPAGAWVVPIFVLGYLLRGAGLFHPETFYPDVANARDYVEVFRETSGSLAERGVETQKRTNVGYPRAIAGEDYAFPYSPLYFLPFGLFSSPGAIEDAVRHLGLAAGVLAMLPLFWLTTTIFGPSAAVWASLLWTVSPPAFSRLLLALHATVLGNFLDLLVVASVLALVRSPGSRLRLAAFGVATLTALLVYTSSLFSVSAFLLLFSVLLPRLMPRLLAVWAVSVAVTIGWLYWPFTVAFATEILPTIVGGAAGSGVDVGRASPFEALGRIPLFYGYLYPILTVGGFVLARRLADLRAFRLLAAYGLGFLLMLSLRAFGAGLFKDLKEILFVAPLVAILSGAFLDALWRRGGWGRATAVLFGSALVLFGLGRYRAYLDLYASPLTVQAEKTSASERGEH